MSLCVFVCVSVRGKLTRRFDEHMLRGSNLRGVHFFARIFVIFFARIRHIFLRGFVNKILLGFVILREFVIRFCEDSKKNAVEEL